MGARRNSSVELLRIISIVMILSMHVLGPFGNTQNLFNQELIIVINAIGNTGVSLFVLISGFYGITFSWRKLFTLVNLVLFYSLLSLLFLKLFNGEVPNNVIFLSCFPTLSNKYWFATSYIILFCLSGYINRGVSTLSKHSFEILLGILILFFIISPTFLIKEIIQDTGKGPVNFLLVYLIGRYFSVYGFPEKLKRNALSIVLISILVMVAIHTMFLFTKNELYMPYNRDNSLFILMAALGIFYLFEHRTFYVHSVNVISKYVFAVYLCNFIFLRFGKINIDSYWLIAFLPLKVCALFLISMIVEFCRVHLLGLFWQKLLEWECDFVVRIEKSKFWRQILR